MGWKILVVDDSATVRAVIVRSLEAARVPVARFLQAGHGAEALDILGREAVDLVFSDINMPTLDGLGMVEKMRAEPALAATKVVIISTEGSADRVRRLRELGVRAYVRKPFTPEQLRAAVKAVMGVEHA